MKRHVGSIVQIPIYPHLEQLLGYEGNRRFVILDATESRQIAYHDGIVQGICSAEGWRLFAAHPDIAPLLFRIRPADGSGKHCLLLDREKRQLYHFLQETAECLLISEKNRPVPCTQQLLARLEGIIGIFEHEDPLAVPQPEVGSRDHFLRWMSRHRQSIQHKQPYA